MDGPPIGHANEQARHQDQRAVKHEISGLGVHVASESITVVDARRLDGVSRFRGTKYHGRNRTGSRKARIEWRDHFRTCEQVVPDVIHHVDHPSHSLEVCLALGNEGSNSNRPPRRRGIVSPPAAKAMRGHVNLDTASSSRHGSSAR